MSVSCRICKTSSGLVDSLVGRIVSITSGSIFAWFVLISNFILPLPDVEFWRIWKFVFIKQTNRKTGTNVLNVLECFVCAKGGWLLIFLKRPQKGHFLSLLHMCINVCIIQYVSWPFYMLGKLSCIVNKIVQESNIFQMWICHFICILSVFQE